MVNSGILVMLHITLSDVICDRMMLNLSAIVMLTAGVLSILHTTPEFVISFHLLVPVSGPTLLLITIQERPLATRSPSR